MTYNPRLRPTAELVLKNLFNIADSENQYYYEVESLHIKRCTSVDEVMSTINKEGGMIEGSKVEQSLLMTDANSKVGLKRRTNGIIKTGTEKIRI